MGDAAAGEWIEAEVEEVDETDSSTKQVGSIDKTKKESVDLWYADICVENTEIHFKLDTGSQANIVPRAIFDQLTNTVLKPSGCRLITYARHHIYPVGEADIEVYNHMLRFQVTKTGSPILGKKPQVYYSTSYQESTQWTSKQQVTPMHMNW